MSTALIVEDEPAIAELVGLHLRHAGFDVAHAATTRAAQASVDSVLPDLVVLDWMLPDEPGPALLKRWRADPRTRELPVIMLTARASESDLVQGLECGADDYLRKPFSPRELVARARALLRRRVPHALSDEVVLGDWRLQPLAQRLQCGQGKHATQLTLGPTETRLLHVLMTRPNTVLTRSQLLDRVWGDHVAIEERTVDVHIKRLRGALGQAGVADCIETVRGSGYRLQLAQPARERA